MKKKGTATVFQTSFIVCPAKRSCNMLVHKKAIEVHLKMNHLLSDVKSLKQKKVSKEPNDKTTSN